MRKNHHKNYFLVVNPVCTIYFPLAFFYCERDHYEFFDRNAGISLLYLYTKFQLDQFTNNRDLAWKESLKKKLTHTQTGTDILPI